MLRLELSHQGSVARNRKGIVRVGRDLVSVLRPPQEGVACIFIGCHRALLPLLVGATAIHRAASRRVSGNIDVISVGGLHFKVRHQGAVICYRKGIVGIGGNHIAALSPIGEGVAVVGRSTYCAAFAVVIGAATTNRTTAGWVSGDTNRIALHLEVRHQITVAVHDEGVSGIDRSHFAILRPVDESVALIRGCFNCALIALLVSAATRHRAAIARIGRNIDSVFRGCLCLKVGHQNTIALNCKLVFRQIPNLVAVLCPIDEGEACIGSSFHLALLVFMVGSTTSHRAALGWVGRHLYAVFIGLQFLEVGHQIAATRHCEGVLCTF